MKGTILILLFLILTSSCKNKESSHKISPESSVESTCLSGLDINPVIVAILSEKEKIGPFFNRLYKQGLDSVEIASNLNIEQRTLEIDGKRVSFVSDSPEPRPRIILAIGKNCSFGKFEFGTKGYAFSGSFTKEKSKWVIHVEDEIQID